MANLLANPLAWKDGDDTTPPSYWDGTSYQFLVGYSWQSPGVLITNVLAPAAGDVFSMQLTVNAPSTRGTSLYVLVNGAPVYSNDLTATGSFTFTSAPLTASDTVEVIIHTTVAESVEAYDVDLTVTAAVKPRIWTDFVGCVEL